MKLTAILIFTMCMQVSAAGTAQGITLSESNTPLKTVLQSIKRQTGYSFFYADTLLKKSLPVSITVKNDSLNKVLDLLFKQQPLAYEMIGDKMIAIRMKTYLPRLSFTEADAITLKGKILNDKGDPVEGASIAEKGTKTITLSDKKGIFILNVKDANSIIIISHASYIEQQIPVKDKTDITVTMVPRVNNLDDMVIIGYQAVRRKDLTGSVSSVNAQQLVDIPVNSAAQALTGRLAGVQVSTSEGGPEAPVSIKIRGGGSITQDNSPLYVIDGIQVENGFAGISPQDIESVDVLKDASATAIYGARGANGVIIITTKGGKPMKTAITYNGYIGFNKLVKELDVMNPGEFMNYQYERIRGTTADSIQFALMYGTGIDTVRSFAGKPNVDWQKELFGRSALTQTHNIGITGGTQTTSFNLSLTRNDENSVMKNSSYERNLVNFRFEHKASAKFRIGINFRYYDQLVTGSGTSASGASMNGRLRNIVKYRPFLHNTNGVDEFDQAYFDQTVATGMYLINPLQLVDAEYRHRKETNTYVSGFADYTFNNFLSFRTTAGVNKTNQQNNSFDDYITWSAISNSSGTPFVTLGNNWTSSLNVSNVFSLSNSQFRSRFHKNNVIKLLLGQELYESRARYMTDMIRYFPKGITPETALDQLSLGSSMPLYPTVAGNPSRILSFFSRANYTYKDKYLATFTFRADGSTKFAKGHQWGYFPSGSFAWRVSKEDFMKDVNALSDLKLRVSYGKAGNNRINDFLYQSLYTTANAAYGLNDVLTPGLASPAFANPDLTWETTISRNIGLDIAFLKNRIQLTIDAYRNDTRDLLLNVPVATNSGYSNQLRNVGSTRNTGIEFQLATIPVSTKKFTWNLNFNVSSNRNRVTALASGQNNYFAYSGWGLGGSGQLNDFIVQVGKPVGSMYGFVTDGFYTLNDFDYNSTNRVYSLKAGVANNSGVVGLPQPGFVKFKDLNGDGVVDDKNDRRIIGNATPKFYGGINNQLAYKNFDLSVFLNFVYGTDVMNGDKIEFTNSYNLNTNLLATMNNRWRTMDDNGKVTQAYGTVGGKQVVVGDDPKVLEALNKDAGIWQPMRAASGAYVLHSWAIEDGSFIRVNNVTLGYTLPASILKKKISSVRVYVTANNLALITSYTGFDPEVSTKNQNYVTPNVDASPYPRSRLFLFGVNVKF